MTRSPLLLALLALGCAEEGSSQDAALPPSDAPQAVTLPFVVGAASFRPLDDAAPPRLSVDEFGWGPTWRFGAPPSRVMAVLPIPSHCRGLEVMISYNKGYLGGGTLAARAMFRAGPSNPVILGAYEDSAQGDGSVLVGRVPLSGVPAPGETYLVISGNTSGSWLIYVSGTMSCQRI